MTENNLSGKEKCVMDNLWLYILIAVLVSGGGCSLAGTWWSKKKKDEKEDEK